MDGYYYKHADWSLIPEHMREGVFHYIMDGTPPGDFLKAVFANDLMEAFGRADDVNQSRLGDYAAFIYNFTPSTSHGSEAAVTYWIAKGGVRGAPPDFRCYL